MNKLLKHHIPKYIQDYLKKLIWWTQGSALCSKIQLDLVRLQFWAGLRQDKCFDIRSRVDCLWSSNLLSEKEELPLFSEIKCRLTNWHKNRPFYARLWVYVSPNGAGANEMALGAHVNKSSTNQMIPVDVSRLSSEPRALHHLWASGAIIIELVNNIFLFWKTRYCRFSISIDLEVRSSSWYIWLGPKRHWSRS